MNSEEISEVRADIAELKDDEPTKPAVTPLRPTCASRQPKLQPIIDMDVDEEDDQCAADKQYHNRLVVRFPSSLILLLMIFCQDCVCQHPLKLMKMVKLDDKQLHKRFPPLSDEDTLAIEDEDPGAIQCTDLNFRVDFSKG